GVEGERPVVDGESTAQPGGAETEEREEVHREGVAAVERDAEMRSVLRPRAEEERDQAMIEEIEEVGERAVALAQALDDERRVVPRQRPHRAGEAHVPHHHARWPIVVPLLEVENLAGGERERGLGAEAHGLRRRWAVVSDAGSPWREPFQEMHRLEEPEAVRLQEEPLAQSRICSPARGGH